MVRISNEILQDYITKPQMQGLRVSLLRLFFLPEKPVNQHLHYTGFLTIEIIKNAVLGFKQSKKDSK